MLHNRWKVIECSGQKPSLPWLLCNYGQDVRTCNQLRNPWQFLHSEHMGRQAVILHVPFVTDASTRRLQHVWPYCTHTQHWILHNLSRLSKHDDGETSNKYQSFCRDDELPFWVIGLWEGSVWALWISTVWLHLQALTPQIEVTSLSYFSIVSCLTAKSIWVKKKRKIQDSRGLYWSSVPMLYLILAFYLKSDLQRGRANNDCALLEAKSRSSVTLL